MSVPSFARPFINSFVRSFIYSFIRSFVRSFVCSFVRSFVRYKPIILNTFVASTNFNPKDKPIRFSFYDPVLDQGQSLCASTLQEKIVSSFPGDVKGFPGGAGLPSAGGAEVVPAESVTGSK